MRCRFRQSRAILLLCLLVQLSASADQPQVSSAAAPQDSSITHPASWLTWGFESRNRWEFTENATTLQDGDESEASYLRLRNRVWTEIEPITNVAVYARLMTEPRYHFRPTDREGWSNEEGLIDELYLDADELFGQPLRIKAGRQEMKFGDRWLVFDGTPGDGSRTEFFDAAKLTVELSDLKTTVDLIGIMIASEADEHLPVINDRNDPLAEQDERAGIFYASHEFNPAARLDAHYMFRHLSRQLANGDDGNLHTPGFRFWGASGALAPVEGSKWEYFAEAAIEIGDKNGRSVAAWGMNSEMALNVGGAWRQRFYLGYECLSGDDPDSDQDEGWDPMWSRRARFSELLVFTFASEANGRRGYFTNLQRPNAGWTASPLKPLQLILEYAPLFANTNPNATDEMFSEDGRFRGHLIHTTVKYAFTRHVAALVRNEIFLPGDYYDADHRDAADFLRLEVNVTF